MVRLTISPRSEENLYGLLVQKELALRKKNQGTLHRYGPKEKWGHTSRKGGSVSSDVSDRLLSRPFRRATKRRNGNS